MNFRAWAEKLLSSPHYAAGFALVCTLVPFTEWVAWAWLVLTTLRYGWQYSIWVLVATSFGVCAVLGLLNGLWGLAAVHVGLLIIPIWFFSLLLRASVSLSLTLQCIGIAILAGLGLAAAMGMSDPTVVTAFLMSHLSQVMTLDPTTQQGIEVFAEFFVIYWPAALLWSYLLSLFLGRWWQAALDNPGGFKREFHALRLNQWVGVAAIVMVLLSFWALGNNAIFAGSILATSVLVVAGLGLVHEVVQVKRWSVWVLVGIYVGIFFLSIIVVPLLMMVAVVDSAADLRKRLR